MAAALAAVVLLLAWPMAVRGDDDNRDYTVALSPGWGNCYRPFRWMPIELRISTRYDADVAVAVSAAGEQDNLTEVTVHARAVLNRNVTNVVPLVTKLNFAADGLSVNIRPDDRKFKTFSKHYGLWDGGPESLTPVQPQDMLIGVSQDMATGLAMLKTGASCSSGDGRVYVEHKAAQMLPWDWTGYDSLDLLVLRGIVWNDLRAEQSRAIVEWVSKGGRVVIVPGSEPLPVGHPLAVLLPVKLDNPTQVALPGDTGRKINRWFTSSRAQQAGMKVSSHSDVFVAMAPFGFGWAGALSGDPAELGRQSADDALRFWADRVGFATDRLVQPGAPQGSRASPDRYNYEMGEEGKSTNALLEHLFKVPQMEPLNIWWIVLLLVSMAVVIGPIDYLVLKRLDRLPWTWVSCAVLIALFTAGAYWGVKALRSGDTVVRSVTIIDAIDASLAGPGQSAAGEPVAWSTCYTGIFASDSDTYRLDNLGQRQWWSSVCPTKDDDLSAFDDEEFATRQIAVEQGEGCNRPARLPISIWSMQCLIAEQRLDGGQVPVAATVRRDGQMLVVNVTNRSDTPFDSGAVVTAGGCIAFGAVPARSQLEFRRPVMPVVPDSPASGAVLFDWLKATGLISRTQSLANWIDRGAAEVSVYSHQPHCPHPVAGRCSQDHVQCVRLVVPVRKGTGGD